MGQKVVLLNGSVTTGSTCAGKRIRVFEALKVCKNVKRK